MKTLRHAPALLAVALLSACGDRPPADQAAVEVRRGAAGNAAAPAPPPEPAPLAAIPERFRGRWDASAAACAVPDSPMRVHIAGDGIRFHESVARLLGARAAAPNSVEVALGFAGEGERWQAMRTLRLLQGGVLEIEAAEGTARRVRCPPAAPAPVTGWQSAASGEGAALFLAAPGGGRTIALFCPAGSGDLLVNVPAFRPVGSEERMTFGAGGTAVTLVADPSGDAQRGGVTGVGPLPDALAEILEGQIGVNYGAQDSGPHPAPPPELAEAFVDGCSG